MTEAAHVVIFLTMVSVPLGLLAIWWAFTYISDLITAWRRTLEGED